MATVGPMMMTLLKPNSALGAPYRTRYAPVTASPERTPTCRASIPRTVVALSERGMDADLAIMARCNNSTASAGDRLFVAEPLSALRQKVGSCGTETSWSTYLSFATRADGHRAAIESAATIGTEYGAFDGGALPDRFRHLETRHQDGRSGSTALTASRTRLAAPTIDSASSPFRCRTRSPGTSRPIRNGLGCRRGRCGADGTSRRSSG